MTSYQISIGYNSKWKHDEVLPVLKRVVQEIQENPTRIAAEAVRLEPNLDHDSVLEYAESYRPPVQDLTIRWEEDAIRMLASGGYPGRDLKEACRRAFIRLVTEAMHRETMEINIIVG